MPRLVEMTQITLVHVHLLNTRAIMMSAQCFTNHMANSLALLLIPFNREPPILKGAGVPGARMCVLFSFILKNLCFKRSELQLRA